MSPDTVALTLFVAGRGPRAERAERDLVRVCSSYLKLDEFRITVIDVLDDPEAARDAQVFVTPTVVRERPFHRKIVGDLSDVEGVAVALGITSSPGYPWE